MKRTTIVILALAFVGTAVAAPAPDVAALTRVASKLSGLRAKRPVPVQVVSAAALERRALALLDREYPRERQAYDETVYRALGLLGPDESLRRLLVRRHVIGVGAIYDTQRRTVYARPGRSHRNATLKALLRALTDQAFDLRRLAARRRAGRDAELGAAAAVDGAVAYVHLGAPIEIGGGSTPAETFVDLEAAFREAMGAALAARLDHLGGRSAVWSALRRFPETTEQVFHVDAFLTREPPLPLPLPRAAAGFEVVRTDTWGELDVRALLAAFGVERADVAGTGWGAGASALYHGPGGDAVALVLAWDTDDDAAEWTEAVDAYVDAAFDGDRHVAGRSLAFTRTGVRTAFVVAPDPNAAVALAGDLAALPQGCGTCGKVGSVSS